jgi:cell division transport system ATP-binding protein
MVRFESVGLRYDRTGGRAPVPEVLRDIDFELPDGTFCWLRGPSGAGKTSLLRLMYLAVLPTSGRLTMLGADIGRTPRAALSRLRRRIGVVFQDFRLLPHLTAFENVALPLRLAGGSDAQIRADVTEQQRVAIARAVIGRPSLLLADEPTGNLDEAQAERLMVLLRELNRLGTTVVVASHNDALVNRHPAATLRLDRGRLMRDA